MRQVSANAKSLSTFATAPKLIASFDVARGAVIQGSVGATEADYLEHVKQTVATDPQANKWHGHGLLNTHQSESLVRYVAGA